MLLERSTSDRITPKMYFMSFERGFERREGNETDSIVEQIKAETGIDLAKEIKEMRNSGKEPAPSFVLELLAAQLREQGIEWDQQKRSAVRTFLQDRGYLKKE